MSDEFEKVTLTAIERLFKDCLENRKMIHALEEDVARLKARRIVSKKDQRKARKGI